MTNEVQDIFRKAIRRRSFMLLEAMQEDARSDGEKRAAALSVVHYLLEVGAEITMAFADPATAHRGYTLMAQQIIADAVAAPEKRL